MKKIVKLEFFRKIMCAVLSQNKVTRPMPVYSLFSTISLSNDTLSNDRMNEKMHNFTYICLYIQSLQKYCFYYIFNNVSQQYIR